MLLKDGMPKDYAAEAPRRVDATMGDCLLRLYRSGVTVGADWQPGLADVTAPGLVIWGERDQTVPVANADILARDTSARRVLRLNAGHWWPFQRLEEVATALVGREAIVNLRPTPRLARFR